MEQKEVQDPWPVPNASPCVLARIPGAVSDCARGQDWRGAWTPSYSLFMSILGKTLRIRLNSLKRQIQFSESLGAKVVKLKGKDVSSATAESFREKQ